MRLAIQNGTPLVPMYGFGETSLFYQVSFWREHRLRWSRLLGFPFTIFTGMLGSPAPVRHSLPPLSPLSSTVLCVRCVWWACVVCRVRCACAVCLVRVRR